MTIGFVLVLCVSLAACTGGKSAVIQDASVKPGGQASDEDLQNARRHFVEGSLYEMQGDYRKAVEAYLTALQYDENAAIYFAVSKSYLELNKIADAAAYAREAVNRDENNISYRENLANISIRAREIETAIGQYERIIEIDPYHRQAYYTLARLYQIDRPLHALKIYNEMTERFGEQMEILAQIVDLNNALGRHDEAVVYLRQMLEIEPENENVLMTLGNTLLYAGKPEEAKEVISELVQIYPDDIDILTLMVDIFIRLRDFESASDYLSGIIRKQELPLDSQIYLGQTFIQLIEQNAGDEIDAVKYAAPVFDAIIEGNPNAPQAHFLRGMVAIFSGETETALDYLIRVTELDPDNTGAWLYAGEAFFQLERFEDAIGILLEGLRLHPGDFELNFLLGLSFSRIDDGDNARKYLGEALALNPDNVNVLSMLALTYDSEGNHAVADSLYEVALGMDPDNHLILNNYSYSLAEREMQLERALEMSRRAVDQQSENSAYLDTLGWIFFKLGDLKKAEEYVRKAIDVGSESAVVHDHMGDIYYSLGQHDKAIEFWKKALELDDSSEEIREKIERVSI